MTVLTSPRPTDGQASLLDLLTGEGLLVPTGIDGLYGRAGAYLDVADRLHAMVSAWGASFGATRLRVPPVLARSTFSRTNYLESFPDLMGSVHVFTGGDAEHRTLLRTVADGGDVRPLLDQSDVVLAPAACHAVYPLCRGTLGAGGRYFDVSATCFRREPSLDPMRLQSFEMHQIVYVGPPEAALAHRDDGLQHGMSLLRRLGLAVEPTPASDPFFGRLGTMLATSQLDDELKIEGVVTVRGQDRPTAVLSANAHHDHFGHPFGIATSDGDTAHSACVAFGIDRLAVALFALHGPRPTTWPAAVRAVLGCGDGPT